MSMNDMSIRFLYRTVPGRGILKLIVNSRADRLIARFLRSRWSRPIIPWYVQRHNVKMDRGQLREYETFRVFFARERGMSRIDMIPEHLISPCDGWLRAYPIETGGSFTIKDTRYRLEDLLDDPMLAKHYEGGTCLVFRLCASDYHHYCYSNHFLHGYFLLTFFLQRLPGVRPGEVVAVQMVCQMSATGLKGCCGWSSRRRTKSR